MSEEGVGLVGGAVAGRPLLSGSVIAFAACALTAVGFRQAPQSFIEASLSFIATLFAVTVIPAGLGAIAPRNFWLRGICAALIFGFLLAARRALMQAGVDTPPMAIGDTLVVVGAVTFFLVIGAPMWRSAVGLSMVGLLSSLLAAAAGLAILAIETARDGAPAYGPPMLALASALGVSFSVQIASTFARYFADGGNNFTAAASAAQACVTPAFNSIALGVIAISFIGADAGELSAAIQSSAGVIAVAIVSPLFFLPGALALKGQTEATALVENRRRASLRPVLIAVRKALSSSVALAITSILMIAAVVAFFEVGDRVGASEALFIFAAAAVAALMFVSLRTGLLTGILVAIVGLLGAWGGDALHLTPLTKAGTAVAACLFCVLMLQLFIAWRNNRSPRRKTREVMLMALEDSFFSYCAASALAVGVIAGSEVAGIWSEGVEVALYSSAMLVTGAVASVPIMTAVGALFGRN